MTRRSADTLLTKSIWAVRRLRASFERGVPLNHGPRIILAAGMNRSGSTWVYNAARLLLKSKHGVDEGLACGWIHDFKEIPRTGWMLVKLHEYDVTMIALSELVIYSYRDVRDVLASAQRMWGTVPSLEAADHHIEQCRSWMKVADVIVRYETLVEPKPVLQQLAQALDVESANLQALETELDGLHHNNGGPQDEPYDRENLLQRGHRTDGRHGSWTESIDPNLIRQIEEKHQGWFRQFDYPYPSA